MMVSHTASPNTASTSGSAFILSVSSLVRWNRMSEPRYSGWTMPSPNSSSPAKGGEDRYSAANPTTCPPGSRATTGWSAPCSTALRMASGM